MMERAPINEQLALGIFYKRAEDRLRMWDSRESKKRRIERKILLNQHPELRKRLDFLRLKQVLDYIDFKCSPLSSVARDEAIAGSDIDGGMVITIDKPTDEQKQTFIEEIRRQGFTAYSPLERKEARVRAFSAIDEEKWGRSFLLSPEQVKRPGVIDFCSIEFFSQDEITKEVQSALRTKNVKTLVAVYLAGASLKFNGSFNCQSTILFNFFRK